MKSIYYDRKTFAKYDDEQFIVYLNEEVLEDYVPENTATEEAPQPKNAYAYTGDMEDGGTLIQCKRAVRDDIINGLIRLRYSQTQEDAVKTHQIQLIYDPESDKADEYRVEWGDFNAYREHCIATVDKWLAS